MLFNSFTYLLIFFPVVAVGCYLLRLYTGSRIAQIFLLVASLVFYGWNKPSNLPLLAGSILVNWTIARSMHGLGKLSRRRLLRVGLVANVLFLCLFKYVNFAFAGFSGHLGSRHLLPNWSFPLGISFFTLQQIMYLVDCYEELVPAGSLFDHATFVAFFPYVISGPISKAARIVPQFARIGESEGAAERISQGLYLFTIGLGKKVIFADSFSRVAAFGFDPGNASLSSLEAWVFSISFTLQLYYDFSGYSDMAKGSALILGISIPQNFLGPLRSKSIIEFWRRWHITLSDFITTYLYTPLLKSFKKATLTTASIATLVAMGVAGLWHGPARTFVAFGLLHGIALVTNQWWKKKKMPKPSALVGWALTFAFINAAFIFFNATSIRQAVHMTASLVQIHHPLGVSNLRLLLAGGDIKVLSLPMMIGVILAFAGPTSEQLFLSFQPNYKNCLLVAGILLAAVVMINSTQAKQFVYFAF